GTVRTLSPGGDLRGEQSLSAAARLAGHARGQGAALRAGRRLHVRMDARPDPARRRVPPSRQAAVQGGLEAHGHHDDVPAGSAWLVRALCAKRRRPGHRRGDRLGRARILRAPAGQGGRDADVHRRRRREIGQARARFLARPGALGVGRDHRGDAGVTGEGEGRAPRVVTPHRKEANMGMQRSTLLAVVFLCGLSSPSWAEAPKFSAPKAFMLGLGDSLMFGFQETKFVAGWPDPDPATLNTGLADVFVARLAETAPGKKTALVNFACPGETTGSFLNGACPYKVAFRLHQDYTGAQMDVAEAFLEVHRGHVSPILISL